MESRVWIQSAQKTLCSLSPTPVMLHIKFDQDWPTGFRDIQVWKCGRRTTTTDEGPLVYYKLTLWAFGSGELKILTIRDTSINLLYMYIYPNQHLLWPEVYINAWHKADVININLGPHQTLNTENLWLNVIITHSKFISLWNLHAYF